MYGSFWNAAAEAFTRILFGAAVALVVGGTAALCLEPSVLFA
jgi:hypothetical protein